MIKGWNLILRKIRIIFLYLSYILKIDNILIYIKHFDYFNSKSI